jgi:uncharacterized protein YdeI (YjbR/CyaY-like superfamily)
VWLVFYKKGSGTLSITRSEAVDEALCSGWIDSKVRRIDDDRYEQYFSRRKPGSPWSAPNKRKVTALEAADRIQPAGRAAIERAKRDGSWSILDEAEALIVPGDLASALAARDARGHFDRLAPGTRRGILQWIVLARRPATRRRRIERTAGAAARGEAPPGVSPTTAR